MVCTRPHCGGLLIMRMVVTCEGEVQQFVCVACGRMADRGSARDPYGPPRVRFTEAVEAALCERPDESGSLGYGHSEDIDLPKGLRDVSRRDTR